MTLAALVLASAMLIALPESPAPTSSAETLTLAEARAMTTLTLAQRVLGLSGGTMHESVVQAGSPPFGSPQQLHTIRFASAPDGSGIPGLCTARLIDVAFLPTSTTGDVPARAFLPQVSELWAALPPTGQTEPRWWEKQRVACTKVGPVLQHGATPSRFFPVSVAVNGIMNNGQATVLATMLQALARPAFFAGVPLTCELERGAACTATAVVAGIDAFHPDMVTYQPCPATARQVCVEAHFKAQATGATSGTYLAIILTLDPDDVAAGRLHPLKIKAARVNWVS